MTGWLSLPTHRGWLQGETERLLAFGRRVAAPGGGAGWLDDDGTIDPAQGVHTWITARMVHVYGIGALLGRPGCAPVADACLAGLTGPAGPVGAPLHDDVNGGWFAALDAAGEPTEGGAKVCYAHAFVVLAASTATLAGRPGARELLTDALEVFARFWDEDAGRNVDAFDATFTVADPYRGVNGNMHSVEALLAASDVTGESRWLDRAASICGHVVAAAGANGWRIPEHYDASWVPDLELNRDRPADPFKPYGATVGHGLEWARLLLQLEASLPAGDSRREGLAGAAAALFERAVADGWDVDGAPGFVYTTDWSGAPVVHDRMHWVVAEATNTAAVLHRRAGSEPDAGPGADLDADLDADRYEDLYARWWDWADQAVLDHERGSWHHQLDATNTPVGTVWPGKADLYHAFQATLIPRVPIAPSLASAVARGLLEL